MKALFVESQAQTDNISSFTFRPTKPFSFTAGQFIELTLPTHHENSKLAKRWFTLSNSPQAKNLTITTRVGGDATHSPFKRALAKLQTGDSVDISEPLGDFVLPRFLQTPLIFVAGGIGVTPFGSILQWLADTKEERPIRMLHSVRTENDIMFQDVFDAAKQHVTIIVQQPSAAWGGERGELNAEMILGIEQPTNDTLIYLSGPEPFVQKLERDLIAHGFDRQRIVMDEFQGYSEI